MTGKRFFIRGGWNEKQRRRNSRRIRLKLKGDSAHSAFFAVRALLTAKVAEIAEKSLFCHTPLTHFAPGFDFIAIWSLQIVDGLMYVS
jgi:hypothetical protein